MPDGLEDTISRGRLPAGWRVEYRPSVASTQDLARAAAQTGADRAVFVADYQSAGRGRRGRRWLAPPGTALLLSVLFRAPALAPQRYTMLLAVALAEAIEAVAPELRPRIKWPNDLLLDGRKVAGVLAEAIWADQRPLAVVVGAGVNVGQRREELVGLPATSLRVEAGRRVDRGDLLAALLEGLDVWLALPAERLGENWQARLWGKGQLVRVAGLASESEMVEATVLGAEPDGALRLRLADGTEARTTAAELIL